MVEKINNNKISFPDLNEIKSEIYDDFENPTPQELISLSTFLYGLKRAINDINGFMDMNNTIDPYYSRLGYDNGKFTLHNGDTGVSRISLKPGNTYEKIKGKNQIFKKICQIGSHGDAKKRKKVIRNMHKNTEN